MKKNDKTYDKPMKGESSKMFHRFQVFDSLPPEERSIKRTAEILNNEKNPKNSKNKKNSQKISEEALYKTSKKWFWSERSLLHDTDKRISQLEKHKQDFENVTDDLIKSFRDLVDYCKKLIEDIVENPLKNTGEPYSLSTKIKMTYEVSITLKVLNEQIRLCYGYSTTNNDVNLNGAINASVAVEPTDTLEMIREVDEELADLYEPNTEHSDTS